MNVTEDAATCNDSETGPCAGPVGSYTSRSGCTTSERCEAHQDAYEQRMDRLDADLQQRYPGWDNPHSSPPEWLDPTYAGEEW